MEQDLHDKILDAAQDIVLTAGFESMTITDVLENACVTDEEFAGCFKSKNQLAMALVRRFSQTDNQLLDTALAGARAASNDPLQQLLFVIDKLTGLFDTLTEPYPGCVFAAYVYSQKDQDKSTMRVISDGLRYWRTTLQQLIDAVQKQYPPVVKMNSTDLADQVTVILEGAFMMAKSLYEPRLIANQLRLYRQFVVCLFAGCSTTGQPETDP